MTYPFATDGKLGVNFTALLHPSTTGYPYAPDVPQFAVGTQVTGSDGSVWVRVKFGTGGCTAAGYVCTFDTTFTAVMMSNSVGALGDKIGVAGISAAAVANDYGWLQVYGYCQSIFVATLAVANAALASTSSGTAGILDDATGTGTKNISGIFTTVTNAGGSAAGEPGELNWPVIGSTN